MRFQCTCLQYQHGGYYCLITDVLHCWATPLGSLFFLPEFRSMAPLVSWIRGPTLGSLSFVPALWDLFVNADVTSRGFRLWPGAGIRMLRGQGPPDLQAPDPSQPHIYPSPCGARLSQVLVVSAPRPLYPPWFASDVDDLPPVWTESPRLHWLLVDTKGSCRVDEREIMAFSPGETLGGFFIGFTISLL